MFIVDYSLNGLVMGFGKISSNELIPADIRHCISVAVNVDVYIFRPPVGSIIEGYYSYQFLILSLHIYTRYLYIWVIRSVIFVNSVLSKNVVVYC